MRHYTVTPTGVREEWLDEDWYRLYYQNIPLTSLKFHNKVRTREEVGGTSIGLRFTNRKIEPKGDRACALFISALTLGFLYSLNLEFIVLVVIGLR